MLPLTLITSLFAPSLLAQSTDNLLANDPSANNPMANNRMANDPMLVQQRALYQQAVQAQSRGQSAELQTLMGQLES